MEKNSGDTQARFFGKEPGLFYCPRITRMNTNSKRSSPQICADERRFQEFNTP